MNFARSRSGETVGDCRDPSRVDTVRRSAGLKAESAPQYSAANDPAPGLGGFVFSAAGPLAAPGGFALTLSG